MDTITEKYYNSLSQTNALLFRIANDNHSSYESEYDGRIDTYCRYCDVCLSSSDNRDHHSDCVIYESREALGSVWTTYVNLIQAEKDRIQQVADDKAAELAKRREQIRCTSCHSMVTRIGMADHMKSDRCSRKTAARKWDKEQELLPVDQRTPYPYPSKQKQVKKVSGVPQHPTPDGYTGKCCLYCNIAMPHAHPNAKFCTNSGPGNCKDLHNNRQPGRISRSKSRQQQSYISKPYDHMDELDEVEFWDDHKEY